MQGQSSESRHTLTRSWASNSFLMRYISEIIVHCTDTPEGRWVDVNDVDKWHKAKGWKGIGYHYLILLDGTIKPGRPVTEIGAHCQGHNAHSIGVCYVGGRGTDGTCKDTRTYAQSKSLFNLLSMLLRSYPHAHVYGHNRFSFKSCPCFDVEAFMIQYFNRSN